jgi:integrase
MPRAFRKAGTFQANGWYKMIDGKRYRIHCGDLGLPEEQWTEVASYKAAIAHWEKLVGEQPAKVERIAEQIANIEVKIAEQEFSRLADQARAKAVDRLDAESPEAMADYSHLIEEKLRERFDGLKGRLDQGTVTLTELTIGKQFQGWKALQLAANKSPARKKMNIHMCQFFIDFIGSASPLDMITEKRWEDYFLWLAKKEYDDGYKGRILAVAKNYLRWLSGKRLIILPANLNDGLLVFEDHAKEITVIELADLRAFYFDATGQTRLHILLMLNCGFQGRDIAELKQSEIDWKKGMIKRKRSKTRKLPKHKADKVPVVTYKLWDRTFQLLREYNSKTDPVLLTVRGRPWIQAEMDAEHYKNSNSIASNFKWLVKKSGVKISTKQLRTVASTMLGQGPFKYYTEYFLGEVPDGTANKHYIRPSDEEFFKALKWLEKQLGLP